MGIKQLYKNNLRKLPNEYGEVSVMRKAGAHLPAPWYSVKMNKVKR